MRELNKSVVEIKSTRSEVEHKKINVDKLNDFGDNYKKDRESALEIEPSIEQLKINYINDLFDKSEYPESLNLKNIDTSTWERLSKEETKEKRLEYDKIKFDLINKWEKKHKKNWPTYEKDYLDANGKVLRKAGQKYDVHHIQPLSMGGLNSLENIMPLNRFSHSIIHGINGSCKKLEKAIERG